MSYRLIAGTLTPDSQLEALTLQVKWAGGTVDQHKIVQTMVQSDQAQPDPLDPTWVHNPTDPEWPGLVRLEADSLVIPTPEGWQKFETALVMVPFRMVGWLRWESLDQPGTGLIFHCMGRRPSKESYP